MAQGAGTEFTDLPDRPAPGTLYPWLLIAAGTVSGTLHGKFHPAWAAGLGLAGFAGLYVAAIRVRWRTGRPRTAYALLAALCAVTVAISIAFGPDMNALFPLLSIVCGAVVPWASPWKQQRGPEWPLIVVFAVANASALLGWAQGSSGGDIWQTWFGSVLAGMIVALFYRFIAAIAELRRTREELARSAVDAERLRFARDLHDLLGHTLSVMVVKAQVARKLASRDPEQAAQQAADIEQVGRQALTEVREAVTGYRGRGLSRELEAARTALADAGVTAVIRQDGRTVPAEADALLGWVVREGVTNVIRHSGGHECEIDVAHRDGSVTVTITDDGTGEPANSLPSGGHGLDGLRERIAHEGGTLEAGPAPQGAPQGAQQGAPRGFRLAVTVPVRVREEACA